MSYRNTRSSSVWHWCHNCSAWPSTDFREREDKPSTWAGHSLCEECATKDSCSTCQHSTELRTGLASDSALGSLLPAS